MLGQGWSVTPATGQTAERQLLHGHVPAAVARLAPVGRLAGSTRLNLAIGLPLRNREALASLLTQLYDPASPNYIIDQLKDGTMFGPATEDAAIMAREYTKRRMPV